MDTRSDISLLPVDEIRTFPSDLVILAANNSYINTHGEKQLSLNLNLRRKIFWNFRVASAPYPIVGVDLIAHYRFVPYLHNSRLVNTVTGSSAASFIKKANVYGISVLSQPSLFTNSLNKFPEITSKTAAPNFKALNLEHHITAKGLPVSQPARRLPPDQLVASEDIPKTAVITPFGLFEYPYMTFGLRNAGQSF